MKNGIMNGLILNTSTIHNKIQTLAGELSLLYLTGWKIEPEKYSNLKICWCICSTMKHDVVKKDNKNFSSRDRSLFMFPTYELVLVSGIIKLIAKINIFLLKYSNFFIKCKSFFEFICYTQFVTLKQINKWKPIRSL